MSWTVWCQNWADALSLALPTSHALVRAERDAIHHVQNSRRESSPLFLFSMASSDRLGHPVAAIDSRSARSYEHDGPETHERQRREHPRWVGSDDSRRGDHRQRCSGPTFGNWYVWVAVLSTVAFGDDRVCRRLSEDFATSHTTVCVRGYKFLWQCLASPPAVGVALVTRSASSGLYNTQLMLPVLQGTDARSSAGFTCRSRCSCWSSAFQMRSI